MLETYCLLSHPLLHCVLLLVTLQWPHILLLSGGKCLCEERGSEQHMHRIGFVFVLPSWEASVIYGVKVRPRHINHIPVVMWEGFLYTRSVLKHIPVSCLWGTQENSFHYQILSHRSREMMLKKEQESSEPSIKGGGPFLCWSLLMYFFSHAD